MMEMESVIPSQLPAQVKIGRRMITMKKTYLILSFFIVSVNTAFTAEATFESCYQESLNYGQEHQRQYSQECKEFIFNNSYTNAYRNFEEKDVVVFGHGSSILAYIGERSGFEEQAKAEQKKLPFEVEIGGSNMNIENILAIDIDFKDEMIVALVIERDSGKKAIYSFNLFSTGSHVPLKKFSTDYIQEATNIKIDNANEKIYVINESNGNTIAYNTDTDDRNTHHDKFKSTARDRLGGKGEFSNLKDITFSPDGKEIYVLNGSSNKISIFNSGGEFDRESVKEKSISPSIKLERIEYSFEAKGVLAVTPQGKLVNIAKGSFVERTPASTPEAQAQPNDQENNEDDYPSDNYPEDNDSNEVKQ